ncbi:MAG: HAD family phosphatase [Pseudomonadota bacterium]
MKAIVFDVGNVLLRWDPKAIFRAHFDGDESIDAFFSEIGFTEWNLSLDKGRDLEEAISSLVEAFPKYRHVIPAFRDDWHASVSGEIRPSVEALSELRAAGIPTYAITNFSSQRWLECQDRFPFLATHFIDAVVSGDEKLVKPSKEIYELFLSRNKLKADDCLFIDDSAANVRTASKLGFETIHFVDDMDLSQHFKRLGLAA